MGIMDSLNIDEFFEDVDKVETLCRYLRSVEINNKNILELEKLLNLLEIQEECIRVTRKELQLKQSNYYMRYINQQI